MENSGVFCDVQGCAHNINCQKCDLSQIKITHHADNQSAMSRTRTTARATSRSEFSRTQRPRRGILCRSGAAVLWWQLRILYR